MASVIQKEHELICGGCGCVLNGLPYQENYVESTSKINVSVSMALLGSALDKNIKNHQVRNSSQYYEEQSLRYIENMIKVYNLPEILAFDVFRIIKKKNHFRSRKEPMKELIRILEKDDYYLLRNKLKLIKADYENYSS